MTNSRSQWPGVVLSATALVLSACTHKETPPAEPPVPAGAVVLTPAQLAAGGVATDTVRLERVALPLVIPGTVATPDFLTASVGSIVDGRVEAVQVLPGDRVAAGAELVHIHSHELATAQRDLAAGDAQVAYAQAAYDRSARLLVAEAVSKEEVQRRRLALDEALAEQARSREMVTHLSPSPKGDVVVRAPRAGTVFAVHVRPGEAVVAGAPLVDMGDASRLWVTGYVPENASVRFRTGSVVQVTFGALRDTVIPGRIVRIGGVVDSLRRALEVRVELARVPAGLRPGMFASMVLPAADEALRAVLPADAVQRTADGEVVYVAEGKGLFRARPTRSTALPDGRVAVEDLPAGLVIATRGAYAIKAKMESSSPGAGE